uniref:Ion_trans_2 domain-containing protein n=1 Tax=Heterorhabditis bacteriophora TaxID=37862 RepID=A0A1I7XKE9_HETBA
MNISRIIFMLVRTSLCDIGISEKNKLISNRRSSDLEKYYNDSVAETEVTESTDEIVKPELHARTPSLSITDSDLTNGNQENMTQKIDLISTNNLQHDYSDDLKDAINVTEVKNNIHHEACDENTIEYSKSFHWVAQHHKKIGFRHICLLLVVLAYTLLGASVFYLIEANYEENNAYVTLLQQESAYKGSTFYKAADPANNYKWTFGSAFFFSMNVFTTTGYGSIAPESVAGKSCVIWYGLIFVPLTLVVIRDLGHCGHFFIRDQTILGHLPSILHTVDSAASMPQALRIPTMLIVLFDAVRRIFLVSRSFNLLGHPLLFFVPYSSW